MPSTLYQAGRDVLDLRTQGKEIDALFHSGRVVFVRDNLAQDSRVPWGLAHRIVEEDGANGIEKWFEVGVPVPEEHPLTGNPAAGWTYLNGFVQLDLQWSENLSNWALAKFGPVDGSPESATIDGDNVLIYWARSCYPIDSQIKTGVMFIESCMDDRRQPFTALTINSTVIALPNCPYHMPADAAQLQTDLRAAGWSGSTVAASGPGVWRIDIPNTAQTDFSSKNYLYWPGYYVPDLYGQLSIWVDGYYFSGAYTNRSDVRTALPKQFARISITNLKG